MLLVPTLLFPFPARLLVMPNSCINGERHNCDTTDVTTNLNVGWMELEAYILKTNGDTGWVGVVEMIHVCCYKNIARYFIEMMGDVCPSL